MSNQVLSLQALLHAQPWRSGVGLPRNALDPTWDGYPADFCAGEIDWEIKTAWWTCKGCGYISHSTYTQHKPVAHPGWFFFSSLMFFWLKKMQAHVPPDDALNQMLYVAGVAIRQSAVQPPQQIEQYVQRLVAA